MTEKGEIGWEKKKINIWQFVQLMYGANSLVSLSLRKSSAQWDQYEIQMPIHIFVKVWPCHDSWTEAPDLFLLWTEKMRKTRDIQIGTGIENSTYTKLSGFIF